MALGIRYEQGRDHRIDARLTLDGRELLTARGDYRAERAEPVDMLLTVPGLPLQRLDPLLPKELLRLSGDLRARCILAATRRIRGLTARCVSIRPGCACP